MRIIIKECKKIFDIRILLLLGVFSIFYYMIFSEIQRYPSGGQVTDSQYDIPFMAELIEKWGPYWQIEDEKRYQEKHLELENEFTKIVKQDKELMDAGICDYASFIKTMNDFLEKEELSEQEKILYEKLNDIVFFQNETSKILFEIQALDSMKEGLGYQYGVSEEKYNELVADNFFSGTKLYKKAMESRVKKDYISLVPPGVFFILQKDMLHIGKLILICFFALMIPYQVKEQLIRVIPIYVTTKTGRKIYSIQLLASICTGLLVGIMQMGIYGIIWHLKGLSAFWKCECWGIMSNSYWCDRISFGTYMLLYMVLILIFTVAGIVVIDFIGRRTGNYITAIAFSIPICGVMIYLLKKIYCMLFYISENQVLAWWELYATFGWITVMFIIYMIRNRQWKRTNL